MSPIDGGETPSLSPGIAEASPREELERVVAASVAILEGYEKRCGRGAFVSLQAAEASLYADRDEISLRNQRPQGGWEDRDVPAWLQQSQARQRELRRLTSEPCPADATP